MYAASHWCGMMVLVCLMMQELIQYQLGKVYRFEGGVPLASVMGSDCAFSSASQHATIPGRQHAT